MIKLQPEERTTVREYIRSICGITLDSSKDYLIEGRLARLVEDSGHGSFSRFISYARSDASRATERRVVDAITTGETLFFRDNAPFDLLRYKLIPDLIDRQSLRGRTQIRIWSAACSTGQELYSIAIILKEMLGNTDRYGVRLVGTDISDQAVSRASQGLFSPLELARGMTEALRTKYFTPSRDSWKIRDEIRAMASFRKLNLLQDFSTLGQFDIIFCRNVAIYFSDGDRRSLFGRMERALEPDGCLLVGAMESLSGVCPQFEARHHLRTVYYQSKSAAAPRPRM